MRIRDKRFVFHLITLLSLAPLGFQASAEAFLIISSTWNCRITLRMSTVATVWKRGRVRMQGLKEKHLLHPVPLQSMEDKDVRRAIFVVLVQKSFSQVQILCFYLFSTLWLLVFLCEIFDNVNHMIKVSFQGGQSAILLIQLCDKLFDGFFQFLHPTPRRRISRSRHGLAAVGRYCCRFQTNIACPCKQLQLCLWNSCVIKKTTFWKSESIITFWRKVYFLHF